MLIDDSRAPFVFLRPDLPCSLSLEEQFEQLFAQERPFVLVTDRSLQNHYGKTDEERQEKVLLFKRIKDRLRALCRGMIVLEGDTPMPAFIRAVAATVGKALGFPLAFATDEDDAFRQGQALLASQ